MFISPDPFLWVRDNILEDDFCDSAIAKFLEDDRRIEGACGDDASYKPTVKRSTDLYISMFPEWNDFDSVLSESLNTAIHEYKADLAQGFKLKYYPGGQEGYHEPSCINGEIIDTGYQMQETKPGDWYDWHDDMMLDYQPLSERTLTFIWYLNDIHEGGCTEFMNGIKVQPRQGRMLLFPATWCYIHRGAELKGTQNKYIITGWISRKHYPPEEPKLDDPVKDDEVEYTLDYNPPDDEDDSPFILDETILK